MAKRGCCHLSWAAGSTHQRVQKGQAKAGGAEAHASLMQDRRDPELPWDGGRPSWSPLTPQGQRERETRGTLSRETPITAEGVPPTAPGPSPELVLPAP